MVEEGARVERILIGRIVKVFGIRGEVAILATGEDPDRFAPKARIFVGNEGDRLLTVQSRRSHHGQYLIRFEEVPDRNVAETLVGAPLYRSLDDLPPLSSGTYYHFQLIGLRVLRSDGTLLGEVSRVLALTGSDLLEVRGPEGEWLIPSRKEFVTTVDLAAGEIRLEPRDDLLEAQRDLEAPPKKRPRREGLEARRQAMRQRYGQKKKEGDPTSGSAS